VNSEGVKDVEAPPSFESLSKKEDPTLFPLTDW